MRETSLFKYRYSFMSGRVSASKLGQSDNVGGILPFEIKEHKFHGVYTMKVGNTTRLLTASTQADTLSEDVVPAKCLAITLARDKTFVSFTEWNPRDCHLAATMYTGFDNFPIVPGASVLTVNMPLETVRNLARIVGKAGEVRCFMKNMQCTTRANMLPNVWAALAHDTVPYGVQRRDLMPIKIAFLMGLEERLGRHSSVRKLKCCRHGIMNIFSFLGGLPHEKPVDVCAVRCDSSTVNGVLSEIKTFVHGYVHGEHERLKRLNDLAFGELHSPDAEVALHPPLNPPGLADPPPPLPSMCWVLADVPCPCSFELDELLGKLQSLDLPLYRAGVLPPTLRPRETLNTPEHPGRSMVLLRYRFEPELQKKKGERRAAPALEIAEPPKKSAVVANPGVVGENFGKDILKSVVDTFKPYDTVEENRVGIPGQGCKMPTDTVVSKIVAEISKRPPTPNMSGPAERSLFDTKLLENIMSDVSNRCPDAKLQEITNSIIGMAPEHSAGKENHGGQDSNRLGTILEPAEYLGAMNGGDRQVHEPVSKSISAAPVELTPHQAPTPGVSNRVASLDGRVSMAAHPEAPAAPASSRPAPHRGAPPCSGDSVVPYVSCAQSQCDDLRSAVSGMIAKTMMVEGSAKMQDRPVELKRHGLDDDKQDAVPSDPRLPVHQQDHRGARNALELQESRQVSRDDRRGPVDQTPSHVEVSGMSFSKREMLHSRGNAQALYENPVYESKSHSPRAQGKGNDMLPPQGHHRDGLNFRNEAPLPSQQAQVFEQRGQPLRGNQPVLRESFDRSGGHSGGVGYPSRQPSSVACPNNSRRDLYPDYTHSIPANDDIRPASRGISSSFKYDPFLDASQAQYHPPPPQSLNGVERLIPQPMSAPIAPTPISRHGFGDALFIAPDVRQGQFGANPRPKMVHSSALVPPPGSEASKARNRLFSHQPVAPVIPLGSFPPTIPERGELNKPLYQHAPYHKGPPGAGGNSKAYSMRGWAPGQAASVKGDMTPFSVYQYPQDRPGRGSNLVLRPVRKEDRQEDPSSAQLNGWNRNYPDLNVGRPPKYPGKANSTHPHQSQLYPVPRAPPAAFDAWSQGACDMGRSMEPSSRFSSGHLPSQALGRQQSGNHEGYPYRMNGSASSQRGLERMDMRQAHDATGRFSLEGPHHDVHGEMDGVLHEEN